MNQRLVYGQLAARAVAASVAASAVVAGATAAAAGAAAFASAGGDPEAAAGTSIRRRLEPGNALGDSSTARFGAIAHDGLLAATTCDAVR